jgi:hypothetical protein
VHCAENPFGISSEGGSAMIFSGVYATGLIEANGLAT